MWYTMGMDAARVERLGKEVLADFKARAGDWLEAGRSGAVEEKKRWLVTPDATIEAGCVGIAKVVPVMVSGIGGVPVPGSWRLEMQVASLKFGADEEAKCRRAYARVSRWLTTEEDGDLVWTQRGFRLRRKRGG